MTVVRRAGTAGMARGRWLGLAGVLTLAVPGVARADKYDDAHRQLSDIDGRLNQLAAAFRDTPANDPHGPEQRVVDAELLYNVKNYGEAATLLLDVIERYPNFPGHDDALVLLGEA